MVRFWYTLVLLIYSISVGSALASDRIALVIGNSAYAKVPVLPNPAHDAADMAQALERLGFQVTLLNDATADAMRKALVAFGQSTEGSSIAVVFYAGHGLEAGGENWLVPTDALLRSDTDVESEAVSLRSVTLQVGKASKLGLVILDACRNNPFEAKMKRSLTTRAVMRGLAPVEPSENVLIAYAARNGTTANDGEGHNSPFTSALLRNIETPGLEVSFLFRRVRDDVMAATHREQQPFVYGSLSKEEIYLKPAPVSVGQPPTESKQVAMAPPTSTDDHPSVPLGGVSQPKARSLFTDEDANRVNAVGAKYGFKIPSLAVSTDEADVSNPYAKFVGVWTNKEGRKPLLGRHNMVIITAAASSGWVYGHFLWGPPAKDSWSQVPAGSHPFAEKITDNSFTLKIGDTIVLKLNKDGTMNQESTREGKPSEKARRELSPVWRLTSARRPAGGSDKGDLPSSASGEVRRPGKPSANLDTSRSAPLIPPAAREASSDEARCSRMADKLGCLCAVRNGGGIKADGKGWYSKRGGASAPTNEAFVRCQIRAGR